MKTYLKKYWILILIVVLILNIGMCLLILHLTLIYDESGLTQVINEYELSKGSYPRMLQLGNSLTVVHSNGSIILTEINMDNGTISEPIKIIPNSGRPMTIRDDSLSRIVCIYNSEGLHQGASIGIAFAPLDDYSNISAWTIQNRLLGPVEQPFLNIRY